MPRCTVADCGRETRTKSSPYCELHYSRWKRHGDPLVAKVDHTPAKERWKKCYQVDARTGCWNWTGPQTHGYGFITDGAAHRYPAHVFVYTQVVGPVPKGKELDHKCRNTLCINPRHTEPVTHLVNVRRGDAGIANAAKTHCIHGHEFTPENTIVRKSGYRQCRECHRRDMREYMAARRAKT